MATTIRADIVGDSVHEFHHKTVFEEEDLLETAVQEQAATMLKLIIANQLLVAT